MTKQELAAQALRNATTSQSMMNFNAIFEGFAAKGIDPALVEPRVNVFTFHAWRALGRVVRKGEHGVKVCTWITIDPAKPNENGEVDSSKLGGRRPRTTTVFHLSQTDAA
jgi:antirestriction protein ArdC